MNDIYIAGDGTLHKRTPPSKKGSTPSQSLPAYEPDAQRKLWFWLFSMAVSVLLVGGGLASASSRVDLGSGSFLGFFERLLPFGVTGGALLGAILYGCKGAPDCAFNLTAFLLSPLCAAAGAIAFGLALCIVAFVLIGIWQVFKIAVVIGIVVSIFSGGN